MLVASIAQRIGRKICDHCKITYEPSPEVRKIFQDELFIGHDISHTKILLTKGAGCEQCDHTGYYGRIGIYEILTMTPAINTMVMRHATAADIQKQAQTEGFITMRQDGFMKVLAGITSLEEVMRLTAEF